MRSHEDDEGDGAIETKMKSRISLLRAALQGLVEHHQEMKYPRGSDFTFAVKTLDDEGKLCRN